MSRIYDNWEKLVTAVVRMEQLRELCYATSMSSRASVSTCPSPVSDVDNVDTSQALKPEEVYVNNKPLDSRELAALQTCSNPPRKLKPGTYWYEKFAGGWGKLRKNPPAESVDYSEEERLAIVRLEIAKNDLRQSIAKEARGNAILQASLERRKQALHEHRLERRKQALPEQVSALEQDVARLQEQLQAERDLRAALEVGLTMSSGQFPGSRRMDSKKRAEPEVEEMALAEADVARLKQKVAELHHHLNQQRRI